MDARNLSPDAPVGASVSDRLDSWKAIAAYLKRDIRTLQRWEATEGLPIHRRQHSKYGSVYAYRSEIEAWWKARSVASRLRQPDADRSIKPERSRIKLRFPHLAIYAVLVVALALSIVKAKQMFLNRQPAALPRPVTVAVLPFRSPSDNLEDSNTALNLTDEVITDCKRSRAIHVVDQNMIMPFRNSQETPQRIAQILHSDKVLSGTASRSDNGIHVTAQLIDSKSGSAVWSRQFEGSGSDLLESEKQIASSIASDVENIVVQQSRALP